MADEGNGCGGTIQRGRLPRWLVDALRPRRSGLEQHPGHRREWLPRGAEWIRESPAIEMIAGLRCHLALLRSSQLRVVGLPRGHGRARRVSVSPAASFPATDDDVDHRVPGVVYADEQEQHGRRTDREQAG